jgi:glycosyltransferase involved in cell wall biosynthesis
MADEIARHFPGHPAVPVVPLAPFAMEMGEGRIPAQHLVEGPYILCATHLAVHKNVGPLLAAHAILRRSHPNLRLVLTGARTHAVTGHATPIGTVRSEDDPDVIGLGYVSNEDIDALIAGAAAVVNPSLYEAGNGPGLDAWSLGTPVAMSDIPAFREHLTRLGVEAAVFDPRSPADIAAKVASILDDPIRWRESAARSKAAIRARGWEDVAADYLRVFDSALEDHAHP